MLGIFQLFNTPLICVPSHFQPFHPSYLPFMWLMQIREYVVDRLYTSSTVPDIMPSISPLPRKRTASPSLHGRGCILLRLPSRPQPLLRILVTVKKLRQQNDNWSGFVVFIFVSFLCFCELIRIFHCVLELNVFSRERQIVHKKKDEF